MINPTALKALETAQTVGAWLVAPFRTREAPEPSRTRIGRNARWIAGTTAALMLLLGGDGSGDTIMSIGPLGVTTALAAGVLALLAWYPLVAWRIAAVVTTVWTIFGSVRGPDGLLVPGAVLTALVVATVVVAVRYSRDIGWAALAWTAALLVLGSGTTDSTTVIVLVVALGLAGLVIDARRQRARASAEAQSERETRIETQTHSLVLEERARIARDLHDVVAHHMSMVAVQAETAPYRLGDVDASAREEFASIARSARSALNDVRDILTVLRDDQAAAERAPQPSLEGLESLVDLARGAGGQVELEVVGERRPLPTALELGAYRIVQESLANAARHARGAVVRVVVTYRDGELEVAVRNGRPTEVAPVPAPDDGARRAGGHGLVGMRERAHLLRGRLTAGPTDDGGFEVVAVLPIEEDDA